MHRPHLPAMLVLAAGVACQARPPHADPRGAPPVSPYEGYEIEVLEFRSEVFDNTRALRVLLPPGYHNPDRAGTRYPVLYINDGLMVVRDNRLALGPVADSLRRAGEIRETIFVAIDNGASTDRTTSPLVDRAREFLPYPDVGPDYTEDPSPPETEGRRFPDFVVDEVMPFIEDRFRVAEGAENTGIGGFSYGGTAALYTVIARPGVFGMLMLESTPLWMGRDRELLSDIEAAADWPERIHIGSGGEETGDPAVDAAGDANRQLLISAIRSTEPESCVSVFIDEAGTHDPESWRHRFHRPLEFLLDPQGDCPN